MQLPSLDDDTLALDFFSIPPVCEDEIENKNARGQPRTPEAGDNNSMYPVAVPKQVKDAF